MVESSQRTSSGKFVQRGDFFMAQPVTKLKYIEHISPIYIFTNPNQPRTQFDEKEINELAESIKENGLIQPLVVRRVVEGYELIAGERRLRACTIAGLERVPCVILNVDSKQSAVLALLENVQRKDLSFFEQATAIEKLIKQWGITQEELAQKLGKAQSTIANKLRLLTLAKEERELIMKHNLTERHARALLKVDLPNRRVEILKEIIDRELNVINSEKLIDEKIGAGEHKNKKLMVVKDVRIFLNTINKAIEVMQSAGIDAKVKEKQTAEYVEYTIKIPTKSATAKIEDKPKRYSA